jgi:hypothetical protein
MANSTVEVPIVLNSGNVFAAIALEDERVEINISFHAVCLASKVWKRFLLHPRLVEEKKDPHSEIQDGQSDAPEAWSSGKDDDQHLETEPHDDREGAHGESSKDDASDQKSLDSDSYGIDDMIDLIGDKLDFIAETPSDVPLTTVDFHTPRKILDLTEDPPEAILLLLRIAHLQFDKIDLSLTVHQLYNVATLCDYYDCVHLVRPWLGSWLAEEVEQSKVPGQEEWLTIAWVFGREKVFTELAARMVREVETNEYGDCLASGVGLILSLPLGIIGTLL